MNFKPIKLGVMGLENSHAQSMFAGIMNNPLFEVVAISFDAKRRMVTEEMFGSSTIFDKYDIYYDDKEMVEKHPEIELCILGGANCDHFKEFKLCAERKINVISMKVPTLDMYEYDEMIRLEKESGIKVFIELEMRWYASVERIKDIVEKGSIGEITSFNAYNYSHFPVWNYWTTNPIQSYGKVVPLYPNSKRFRGGALTDHPHIFDLVRYITGSEFESVYAEVAPNMRDYMTEEDLIYITGRLKNGTIVSLDPSYANREYDQTRFLYKKDRLSHYPKSVQVEMSLCGTEGGILCDAYNPNTTEQLRFEDFEYRVNSRLIDLSGNRNTFLEKIAKSVRDSKEYKPEITLEEHKKTMEVVNACYESVYTGKIIKL